MANEQDEFGTEYSHYAASKHGPFRCDNCTHFSDPHYCSHPKVIEDAPSGEEGLKLGKRDEGRQEAAIVQAAGCCGYWWPKS